jgi:signal transduction histidine kinase
MSLAFTDLHLALVMTPVAGVIAWRKRWSRKRFEANVREREERVREAREDAMRAMQRAIEAAASAKRTKEEFLSRMSHELRTPLNAVIGLSRVLEKNRAGNQRPEDIMLLQRVRAGGEQLLRLVEDVLDQAHIERGQLALSLDSTDVAGLVASVVDRHRSRAKRKELRLDSSLPNGAERIPLDQTRFEKVLDHLIDNAIKFTHQGSVRIALALDTSGRPDRLDIIDTGIGISPDRVEQLFKPFEQGDNSTQRPFGGAGLGLPLASQLCEAMRCNLEVDSRVGVGSRFTIRFPS